MYNNRYYTETKQDVTKRIEEGMTEFFSIKLDNAQQKAEKFASQRRSYVYPVFDSKGIQVGYGIPK